MRRHIALLDANILASMTLTDIFVQLAVDDLFHARWTNDIHREWVAAVLRYRPQIDRQSLERRRLQMDTETREALVSGYENIIDGLCLPDDGDRHVLAAAIHGGCDLIVTKNLKHFPSDALSAHGIETQHPDTFLMEHLGRFPLLFCKSVRQVLHRAKRPPYTVEQYLASLKRADVKMTASELEQYVHLLG